MCVIMRPNSADCPETAKRLCVFRITTCFAIPYSTLLANRVFITNIVRSGAVDHQVNEKFFKLQM